ncbi:MAG: AMP-binding protein [Actinobacteria bacterium]|nr:AMP-binding protein [Actinomycetota bacterium]
MTATANVEPTTTVASVPGRIREWARRTPDKVALREKRFGIWQDITWASYWDTVALVAHGLAALGVERGDRVAVHSENRPEWLYADVGTVAAGAITIGLYPTNPPVEVEYLLRDSGAKVLFAEDQEQVDKALAVRGNLPDLEHIVYFEPRGVREYDDPELLFWGDFLERARDHRDQHPDLIDLSLAQLEADDLVTLIYTSGTTGPPKGAMLTVANVEFAITKLVTEGGFFYPPANESDVTLSYLPLCHVAERISTEWYNAEAGTTVHFAESIDTVTTNLREVQPTLFFAVPRIWEKIHAGIQIRMAGASWLKRANFAFWMRVAEGIGDDMVANGGAHTPWSRIRYWVGYPFLYRALRDRIGLRKCRVAGSGAAPIAPEILKWFFGIGVPIYEIYGMTENAAVATSNRPGRVKLGTVGEAHPGIEVRLDEETGEIQTRHPAVFRGYWNKPDKTEEAFTEDGFLRTGDVGEWVDGTHLRIVDRMKDIIITAGGKNISPSEIENSLKTSPFVREAVVIGDRQPYLVALIGLELDTVGEWAQRKRIPYTTYRDLSEKPEVLRLVQGVVRDTNERFARVENVRKFRMITKELDHEDGELTATQKVKRAAIADMFGDLVEDMYGNRTLHAGGDLTDIHSPAISGAEAQAS